MTTRSATIRMPSRRQYVRSRNRKRESFSNLNLTTYSIKGFLASFILIVFIGLSIFTTYQINIVAKDIELLEEQYIALQLENKELNKEFTKLTSNDHLKKLGKKLGLKEPAKYQLVNLSDR